ncbi:hypothetical protein H5410_052099, partial [Solanum commersonii]
MGDALKSSETTTIENIRKIRSGEGGLTLLTDDVMDVSNEISENDVVDTAMPQSVRLLTKPYMDSLVDLVEIKSWTHLFMIKSPVLHEEQVREFYYNVDFVEDGSLNIWVGNKNLYLDEKLLGKIMEVPREGIRSVVRQSCTNKFVKECSKLPDMRRAGVQKKLMKGEYQLLFEFVNK